jgi:hypothetical protein
MPTPRVFPHAVLLIVLSATANLPAQAPPSLGVGSRIQVTHADGSTYTGVVAPKPADPLWQFVSADGKSINFRLSELLAVRMLGREVKLTPGWAYSPQTFAWVAVQTTDGQAMELGIYKWPGFNIVRDDTGATEVNNLWINKLSVVAAVNRPETKAGLMPGTRARVQMADGAGYEGTVVLPAGQVEVFVFVRRDTRDQWKLRLRDIHRLTSTGATDAGLPVVEVETRDGQVYTVAVHSRSAFDLERADTGKRVVNVQSVAAFTGVEAIGGAPASTSVPAPAPATGKAAPAPPARPEFDFQDVPRPKQPRPPGR